LRASKPTSYKQCLNASMSLEQSLTTLQCRRQTTYAYLTSDHNVAKCRPTVGVLSVVNSDRHRVYVCDRNFLLSLTTYDET